jgi:hypothetical protein
MTPGGTVSYIVVLKGRGTRCAGKAAWAEVRHCIGMRCGEYSARRSAGKVAALRADPSVDAVVAD